MQFRGQPFQFDSPAAAVTGMVDALTAQGFVPRTERVKLRESRGRFLAETAHLDRDSPPFDTAVMDGYAIRIADFAGRDGECAIEVRGESLIGHPPPPRTAGTAMRISTGAAVPSEADAVLPRETLREQMEGATPRAVVIDAAAITALRPGHHIRRQGENARTGMAALEAGTLLTAAGLGTLASIGVAEPLVHARLRVAIITTGEEIVAPGATPSAFEIRDSNGPAVEAALASHAWIEVSRRGHARGEATELDALLQQAAIDCDAVLLTGGVSMGHRDPVRAAIARLDARVVFHGLPQRPGKPMLGAVARRAHGGPLAIFALPGNPLSALVTCGRIAVPVLERFAGGHGARPTAVRLARPDGQTLSMWWHRIVRIDAQGEAELVAARSSGDTVAGGHGDGFIEVPPNTDAESQGPFHFHAWPR